MKSQAPFFGEKKIRDALFQVFCAGVLIAGFGFNAWRVVDPYHFETFQQDSSDLVYQKLKDVEITRSVSRNAGFLLLNQEENQVYTSQFGGQGWFLSGLLKWRFPQTFVAGQYLQTDGVPMKIERVVESGDFLNITLDNPIEVSSELMKNGKKVQREILSDANWKQGLSADKKTFFIKNPRAPEKIMREGETIFLAFFVGIWVFFLRMVQKRFGVLASIFLLFFLAGNIWLTLFARNVYWVIFLDFLPFVMSWYFFMDPKRKDKIFQYGALLAVLIFLKSLCGYEYITNVLLSSLLGYLFFALENKDSYRKIFVNSIKILTLGCAGFFLSIALHIVQGAIFTENVTSGVSFVFDRFLDRTYFSQILSESNTLVASNSWWAIFQKYLALPVFGFSKAKISLCFFFVLFFCISIGNVYLHQQKKLASKTWNLFCTTGLSLVFSLSWVVLAKGHMFHHLHINAIVFNNAFLVMLVFFLGVFLSDFFVSVKKKRT